MSTGRIEAAAKKGGVELECKAGEGRRGTFVARFSGNRKKFEASSLGDCPCHRFVTTVIVLT